VSEDILGNLLKNYSKQNYHTLFFVFENHFNLFLIIENDKMDLEDMIDNFLTFFVAGQETTANALAFTVMELGKNKDVLEK
jgi:hypothetical protein